MSSYQNSQTVTVVLLISIGEKAEDQERAPLWKGEFGGCLWHGFVGVNNIVLFTKDRLRSELKELLFVLLVQ